MLKQKKIYNKESKEIYYQSDLYEFLQDGSINNITNDKIEIEESVISMHRIVLINVSREKYHMITTMIIHSF